MDQAGEYALIYTLPEPARSYYLDLGAKVESEFGLTGRSQPKTPPHVTLKYQFVTEDIGEVEKALEEFAATTSPAPWSIRGYNHFITPGNYVIFLEVVPTPAVRVAHAALLEGLRPISWMRWDQYDGPDLHYHVTVAHGGLTQVNFDEVWAFVNAQPPPDFDLYLDTVTLLQINKDVDTVYKTYRLSD